MKTPIAWPRKFLAPARSTAGLRPPLLIGRSGGGLCKGRPLDKQGAVRFRQQGYDVVVCGDDEHENYSLAYDLEKTALPNEAQIGVYHTENPLGSLLPALSTAWKPAFCGAEAHLKQENERCRGMS
jgi:hypothetical protein